MREGFCLSDKVSSMVYILPECAKSVEPAGNGSVLIDRALDIAFDGKKKDVWIESGRVAETPRRRRQGARRRDMSVRSAVANGKAIHLAIC